MADLHGDDDHGAADPFSAWGRFFVRAPTATAARAALAELRAHDASPWDGAEDCPSRGASFSDKGGELLKDVHGALWIAVPGPGGSHCAADWLEGNGRAGWIWDEGYKVEKKLPKGAKAVGKAEKWAGLVELVAAQEKRAHEGEAAAMAAFLKGGTKRKEASPADGESPKKKAGKDGKKKVEVVVIKK